MTRATPVNHDVIDNMDLPYNIKGKEINLYTDVLKTTKCNFLMTKSGEGINFTQAQYLKTMKLDAIQQHLLDQKEVYIKWGFKVVGFHADRDFNRPSLEHALLPTKLHAYSKNEHVGMIEREYCTLKESLCSVTHSLPFTYVPLLMIIELVRHVVDMTNRQPSAQGNYGGMTSAKIVKGIGNIDMAKKQIKFGA
jgi:hypothetical protein